MAWASSDTYSSTAERTGDYVTIAWTTNNGTVAAFADLTFLTEPYCYVEDNYRLVLNLAEAIAGVEVRAEEEEEDKEVPVEEVMEPDLPVGTEKVFKEEVDGEEQDVKWVRVSETEVRIERPDLTSHYYYDEEGSLLRWTSDGMEAVYETPLPKSPYPLTEGKRWQYESIYTLTLDGEELLGWLYGEEEVVGFEEVKLEEGVSYFCAKVKYTLEDVVTRNETRISVVSTGHSWVSSDAGVVKEESFTQTLVDSILVEEETRKLLLRSFKKA